MHNNYLAAPTSWIVDYLLRFVSRTLVRQALYRLSQNRLIKIEPARGAFVAAPSEAEAKQVFEVRRMVEAGMVRAFIQTAKASDISAVQSASNSTTKRDRAIMGTSRTATAVL